jgi:exo-1,4-beta-D-glucosaminidase
LADSFIDWSPHPPDDGMGLWRDVELQSSATPLLLSNPVVHTTLAGAASNLVARLQYVVRVENMAAHDQDVRVTLTVPTLSIRVERRATLTAGEQRDIELPLITLTLDVAAQLWWPWQMGRPTLHNTTFGVGIARSVVDTASLALPLGLRQVTSSLLPSNGARLFAVNGRRIVVRGAGWTPQLFQQRSARSYRQHFLYMRDMHLNTVRLEGKFEGDVFYQLADQYGILTMPGWSCCDSWQHWPYWTNETRHVARQSMLSQARRLRQYASSLVFLYSSDALPPPDIEQLYLTALNDARWPVPSLQSAAKTNSTITGPSGVKMSG